MRPPRAIVIEHVPYCFIKRSIQAPDQNILRFSAGFPGKMGNYSPIATAAYLVCDGRRQPRRRHPERNKACCDFFHLAYIIAVGI
jgi:hypothetical protein